MNKWLVYIFATTLLYGQAYAPVVPFKTTVSGLSSAPASSYTNAVAIITDGASACDTTTGGGSYRVLISSNGTSWGPVNGCSGSGGGLLTFESNGTAVGSPRAIGNWIAGSGITNALSDTGSVININQSVDTSVIQSKANLQTGSAPTTITSASGSGTTYTASGTPTFTAYSTGMSLRWTIDTLSTCTSACTLNLDTLGAIGVKDYQGNALALHALVPGSTYTITFNGTNFLCSECGIASNVTLPYSLTQLNTSAVMTGSPVTIYTFTLPALATAGAQNSCLAIEYQAGYNASALTVMNLIIDGATNIRSNNPGGSGGYWFFETLRYCNSTAQSAQTMLTIDGHYSTSFSGGSTVLGGGWIDTLYGNGVVTPTAVNWATGHTLTLSFTGASGTAYAMYMKVRVE